MVLDHERLDVYSVALDFLVFANEPSEQTVTRMEKCPAPISGTGTGTCTGTCTGRNSGTHP